jgi:hypothetical protein
MPLPGRALHAGVVCLVRSLVFIATPFFLGASGPVLIAVSAAAQTAAPVGPNSDPTYQALRSLTLGGEAVGVSNLVLKRDAGTFHLHSGTVCFVTPVQGKVTGAVFVGDGNFVISASPQEMSMLKLLSKDSEFSESFSHLVLRFTDSTYDEIKKAGTAASGGCDNGLLKDSQNAMRHGRLLKYNLDARILQDVLSPEPGGLFVAFVHGKRYNDKELFVVDPRGAGYLMQEEVGLMTYDENKYGVWAAFPLAGRRRDAGGPVRIEHQLLDTTIEKNASMTGKATTTFVVRVNGARVIPFDLFPTLRVQSVTADGQGLSFIQEGKNDDADFSVIVPKALTAGDKFTITTIYGGKEAVSDEGGGNYFPIAREDWYPNTTFGERVSYNMTFHIPKGMKIAATGELVSESNDGGQNVTVWKSEAPQTVAGFNFGRFKEEEVKLTKPEYLVQSFANQDPPSWVQSLQHAVNDDLPTMGSHVGSGVALGTMSTTGLIKKALAEGELATEIYSDYFGPSSFKRLAITQQTDCRYGQSWPELVWIPMCYFFDTTVRHQLGMDFGDRGYWKVVTPHEVAHQWWGHTVGFDSYRDQWMSEGFADMSASLYLAVVEKSQQKFITFWNDERELLTERNAEGFRAIDAGPVTMGYRMSNSRTGLDLTRRLIYPKGAYILHMIRMMMYDNRTGDQRFKDTMHDFVSTYGGRSATTEDFKSMIEKHMSHDMDLDGNQKMDWFFNEYVYGTQLPSYKLDYSFDTGADGDVVFSFKVTQSNVKDDFRMTVPIYLEKADGGVVFLGRAKLIGNTSVEQKLPMKSWKTKPRRALVNYFNDVLASPN